VPAGRDFLKNNTSFVPVRQELVDFFVERRATSFTASQTPAAV
jgi:hypothetical protein